jgi:hypothetical protein
MPHSGSFSPFNSYHMNGISLTDTYPTTLGSALATTCVPAGELSGFVPQSTILSVNKLMSASVVTMIK